MIFFRVLLLLFLFFWPLHYKSQLVFGNGALMRIAGSNTLQNTYVVLNNSSNPPISISGTQLSGIVTPSEKNLLRYNLSNSLLSITVPYVSEYNEYFPLTLTPLNAGSANGSVDFSTFAAPTRTTGWENSQYLPSQVQNMSGFNNFDNSATTIDRFWLIQPVNYLQVPNINLSFTYINDEMAQNGSNQALPYTLQAIRYSAGNNNWDGFGPSGTNNSGNTVGTVSNVTVTANDWFPWWTLNGSSNALPIQLKSFSGNCNDGKIELKWTVASDLSSDKFIVESSADALVFTRIGTVKNSGQNSGEQQYRFECPDNGSYTYFRLLDENFGNPRVLKLIGIESCSAKNEDALIYNNADIIHIVHTSITEQVVAIDLYDAGGKLILSKKEMSNIGVNTFALYGSVSPGIYMCRLNTGAKNYYKKLILLNQQ
jgi:hypothetical protein